MTVIYPPPKKIKMEDDLEDKLVQQLAEVQRLRTKKERKEPEARLKAEHEAKEKAAREAGERAKREAQERERRENEYWARYQEEQQQKHEVVAQQVAEAKLIQRQVRMPEASRSGRNGESDVSSPSPSPAYSRPIQRQAAQVVWKQKVIIINGIRNREKPGASRKALVVLVLPVGSLVSMRTARRHATGARNGRSHATFLGGSCAG